jgi:CPA1 family monovalent cation:H+ antiporter
MSFFGVFAVLITLAAVFGFVNERTVRLPTAIGVTLASLVLSLGLIALHEVGFTFDDWAEGVLEQVAFGELVMKGMLSFLLFAGSLHVDLSELARQRWPILFLATLGVVASTFLVGTAVWWLLGWLGMAIPYAWALVFGALISPTDPIAVLGILRKAGAPKGVETLITGESLFNDGVGVVVFTALAALAAGTHDLGAREVGILFLEEAVGGVAFGLVLGLVAYWMLKWIDNYSVEVLITLAVVAGGYVLAGALHTSGPLAMVVAGLLLGNRGRRFAMSDRTRENLDTFWELVDEVLNALLFVLIGLEVLVLDMSWREVLVGLGAIPVVLAARLVSVGSTIGTLRMVRRSFAPYTVRLMTWGGLRGGISIALALSLPQSPERGLIVGITYVIVVFSILIQGLTVEPLARRMPAARG